MCRLPNRVRYNRYTGLNRPAYAFWCFLYYVAKDALLLYFYFAFRFFRFVFWDVWKLIYYKFHSEYAEEYEEDDEEDTAEVEGPDDIEELPFCQLFNVGPDMCLMIDHVEMCPDETAYIRVVDDEGYTPLYKRKVRRDKKDNRFIVFNSTNYYLDDKKTQPIITKK